MNGPKEHKHPENPRNKIFGIRLEKGDILSEEDLYPSADGRWQKSQLRIKLGNPTNPHKIFWVRPVPKPEI